MIRATRVLSCVMLVSACVPPPASPPPADPDRLTLGTVQSEIRAGMSGAEVAAVLGAPNIVTTDERRRETWVYDRISTERIASGSGAYGTLVVVGGSTSSGSARTSQRTLTVIIRFDEARRVRDFSYRASSF